jgi:arylsulfatase
MGYDVLAQRRLARMKSLGIVSSHAVPSPRPGFIPGWGELSPEERKRHARAMEIYAAMVETVDDHVGRLIATLKELGRYEDTMILVFSDNGANGQPTTAYPGATAAWLERNSDNRPPNLGRRGSRISTGPGWALASMAPFRMFKTFVSEGGIRSPLIVRGPLVASGGRIEGALADVRDIMPTILEMAGITHPSTYDGRDVLPLQGGSMMRLLQGRQDWVHAAEQAFGYELFGWRGIRQGPWKATWIGPPVGPDEWQLFNLEQDPGETTDLAPERPDQLEMLTKLWEQYVNEMGVVLPVKPSFTAQ